MQHYSSIFYRQIWISFFLEPAPDQGMKLELGLTTSGLQWSNAAQSDWVQQLGGAFN